MKALAIERRAARMNMRIGLVCLVALIGVPSPASGQLSAGETRFQTIRFLIDEGRYAEAEAEAERFTAALEMTQGRESLDLAQGMDLLVEALVRNGKGAERRTLEFAERVIAQKEARAGPTDLALAGSLRNLGDVLVQAGDYQLAKVAYERAHTIREQRFGENNGDVADDLDGLAHLLTLTEKYDEALKVSDRAVAVRNTTSDRADVRVARTLEVRGLLLQRRGDYPGARIVLEHALAIREAHPAHPTIAETLSLLAEQRRFEGDLVEAKQLAARSLAVAEHALRPDHPDIAEYLRILARPTSDLGDLSGARVLRERALAIAERSLGPDHLAIAVQLNDLASSDGWQGEYSAARQRYERALKIYERRLGPDHSYATTEVFNLAVVSGLLGDFSEARRQFNRAITTWERVVGRYHPYVALAVFAFAQTLTDQRRYAEASALYERALSIRERTLGKNHRDVAQTLTSLATSLAKQGQIRRANELSERALTIWEHSSERESRRIVDAVKLHGTLQAQQGDLVGAENSYDRALLILRRIVGNSHPDVAEIRVLQAAALANSGRMSDALGTALDAEDIGRRHLSLMLRSLPERQGLEYAAKRPKGLAVALSLVAPETNGDETDQVFDRLIRSRGIVLDEMARRRHLSTDAARSDLAPLWATLVSARQRFANLVIRGLDERRPEQSAALLDGARREKEEAERAFADKSATFRDELSRIEIGLNEVRTALPPNSALVAFARYDRTSIESARNSTMSGLPVARFSPSRKPVASYVAFVLLAGREHVEVAPLGSASTIDSIVARWREETMGAVGASSADEAEQTYRAAGTALRQRVWDPLHTYVSGAATVFVVPDGTLNLVSFAALPVGQAKYVIDQGPVIHFLSVERDLVSAASPATSGHGLLAVGGAAFNDETSFARTSAPKSVPTRRASSSHSAVASLRAACGTLQSLQFGPLAGTAKEAHEVARLWLDSPAQILEGGAADERTFKREAPGRRVLHLATHGFFLGSACQPAIGGTRAVGGLTAKQPIKSNAGMADNPLLLSGLALAGANRRAAAGPGDDDGILTAEEVAGLNLDGVEWAVLSACDTGLGELKAGEGVLGLRRAFQLAGVRTVIMSLWSVDDQAARLWMRALYEGRLQRHLSTADAMHHASLSVLRARRARGQSTHPFYWAGFVAAGEWR